MAGGQLFFGTPPALPAFLLRVPAHFGRTASPSTRPVDQTWGTSIFHYETICVFVHLGRSYLYNIYIYTYHISEIWPWPLAWSLVTNWSDPLTLKPISPQFCNHETVQGSHTKPMLKPFWPAYSGALIQNPELPTVINAPKRILLGFQPGHVVEAQLVHGTCEIRTGKETTQDSWWGWGPHIRFMMIDGYPHM